jgi:drug/metabolite transporter (DMT)-like permease
MNWIHYAYLSAVLSSVWSLSVKEGIMSSFSIDFTAWYALISTLISLVVNILIGSPLKLIPYVLLGGCLAGLSVICLTRSLDTSPNPGMSMAIFRTQAVFIALAAFLLFGSNLTLGTMLAMVVVIIGVFIVTGIGQKTNKVANKVADKVANKVAGGAANKVAGGAANKVAGEVAGEEEQTILLGKKIVIQKSWPMYALLAAIFVTGKDLITKTAFHLKDANIHQAVFNILLGQAFVLIGYDLYKTGNFNLETKNKANKQTNTSINKKKTILITIWTGIIFFAYLLSLTQATKLSSNVGYVKSIDTFGIVITTIASHYLFRAPLNWKITSGIGIILVGILYISGFNIANRYY